MKELLLNIRNIKRSYSLFYSEAYLSKDIRDLYIIFILLFGLLVIPVSLIKLESVVPGEQSSTLVELCYLAPPVVILPTLAPKLNPGTPLLRT